MWKRRRKEAGAIRSFMARLARDKRGNTLMLTAAAIFPLIGVIGGAVDISRMYMVKTRLQHACDAGALAGRKQMGGGPWTAVGTTSSNEVAKALFVGNFPSNAYGATSATKAFSEASGHVLGTASATVPMTLMAVFSSPSRTLTVTCKAQTQVPNTDVMFVLDTTESMSQLPNGTGHVTKGVAPNSLSKILALKSAVKCFFEALRKLDTNDGGCDAITGTVTTSRLRFGIVPYSTNVNIKNLALPDTYFAQSWNYQSRSWNGSKWRYQQTTMLMPGFKNSWTSIPLALGASGISTNIPWEGCVEENAPITDINVTPNAAVATSKYAPLLPSIVYYRNYVGNGAANDVVDPGALDAADVIRTGELFKASEYPYSDCSAPAYPLQTYADAATFTQRVDALAHGGNTRHDIGMLWGGRLLSPRGIKAGDNTITPNNGKLYRHLVFMTDGDAKANECDYATYGIPWFDKREVAPGTDVSKTSCNNLGNANTTLTNGVNTRLAALCTSIKAEENTIMWVVSFGGTNITDETKARLKTCATDDNHFFDATNTAKLKAAFKQIAAQISQLRLTQ